MIVSEPPVVPLNILEICRRVIDSCGFTLVEARTAWQEKSKILEVTIFHPFKSLSLDDCEQVSRKLDVELEKQALPFLDEGCRLEVQSPGIDRRLKTRRDFEVFTGKAIEIKLSKKLLGFSDSFVCRLTAFNGTSIMVDRLTSHTVPGRKAGKSAKSAKFVKPAHSAKSTASNRAATIGGTVPPSGPMTISLDEINTVKLSGEK